VRKKEEASGRVTRVMIMDEIEKKRETVVLVKGNYEAKTDTKVSGAVPAIFRPAAGALAAGERLNRLDLATWLVSPTNPLVARVAINRAWQSFFGTGIVKTAEDFGAQGEQPSHPE